MVPLFPLQVSFSRGRPAARGLLQEQGAQAAPGTFHLLPDSGLRASFPVVSRFQVPFPSSPGLPASLSPAGEPVLTPVCHPCK